MSNYPWNSKRGYSCVCFYLNLTTWPGQKNEAKVNWNKMEAKMEHIWMKIMVQTSSVKLCGFFILFRVYRWINFVMEKIFSMLPPMSARNLDPTKTAFSKFNFPKILIDDSVTSSCVQKMTQITETKNWTAKLSEKLFFCCSYVYQTLLKTKFWKMVPAMA